MTRIRSLILVAAAAALVGTVLAQGLATRSVGARAATAGPRPQHVLAAHRLQPRLGAVPRGTKLSTRALFGDRVFPDRDHGVALANAAQAQYPALTSDGGRTWRIGGPQLHVDAADGAAGVGFVGAASQRTFFAYGSSVVDVTTDGGRTWWGTYLGESVAAVVPASPTILVAYVQQSLHQGRPDPAVTWQYVSRDGGRHWRYSTALGVS